MTFMKFWLVDRVLQRNLISPSSLQDLQDQPSQEQVLPPAEQVPSVEQLQPQSSSALAVPDADIPTTSPIHI